MLSKIARRRLGNSIPESLGIGNCHKPWPALCVDKFMTPSHQRSFFASLLVNLTSFICEWHSFQQFSSRPSWNEKSSFKIPESGSIQIDALNTNQDHDCCCFNVLFTLERINTERVNKNRFPLLSQEPNADIFRNEVLCFKTRLDCNFGEFYHEISSDFQEVLRMYWPYSEQICYNFWNLQKSCTFLTTDHYTLVFLTSTFVS